MTPGKYPLTIYRGDTYRWTFVLWADDTKTTVFDLTGATVLAQIRNRPGGTLIVPLACVVRLPNSIDATLVATDSAKISGSAAWDLQVTQSDGDVLTVLAGPVNLTVDVTVP